MLILAALCVAAGVVAGLLLVPASTPGALSRLSPTAAAPVTRETFDDPQDVTVTLNTGGPRIIYSPGSGVLTGLSCGPGQVVSSGRVLLAIDGASKLALATSAPLWRDLTPGITGLDVSTLQQELSRLGFPVRSTGVYDTATVAAVGHLLTSRHISENPTTLSRSSVVWLPKNQASITGCPTAVGGQVSAGQPLIQLAAAATSARVSALASSALPGQRILAIGGRSIQLPKSLTFTDTTHLSELQSQLVTAGPPQTDGATTANIVHATATLATAITAYGVPASAVLGTADTTCVVDGNDRSHGVHVLGSTVGKALVTFTQPSAPDTVRIAPAADRTCP